MIKSLIKWITGENVRVAQCKAIIQVLEDELAAMKRLLKEEADRGDCLLKAVDNARRQRDVYRRALAKVGADCNCGAYQVIVND